MTNLEAKMKETGLSKGILINLGIELGRQHQTTKIEFVDILSTYKTVWKIDGKAFEIRTFDGHTSIKSKSIYKEA